MTAAWLAIAMLLLLLASAALAQQPAPGSPTPVDSGAIVRPSGLGASVARDGSGGIVYLRQVGGTPHVFVSQLSSGSFGAPVQLDSGLTGASSQPVIAAASGGLLLAAFINGGQLYVAGHSTPGAPLSAPFSLAGGASNPSISVTNFGKAYLAFAAADGAGSDVRTAYYHNGSWALEGPPLNAVAADNAGRGSGRPDVSAAGDGVAIVAWGENGHVLTRRVWGTTPSVVYQQADAPPAGCTETSADEPAVAAGGDSSYASVAFRELVSCGGHAQSRVLSNRLHASIYDGVSGADGLSTGSADGAEDPQVAVTEYGQGWVTSERMLSNDVFAQTLYQNANPGGVDQVNGLPVSARPYPVPATAGLFSTLIAWQQQPGSTGTGEIRVRYAPDGYTLGPETVVSSPAQGPVDAADGLAAAGDAAGDAAIVWLQGSPGSSTIMVEQLYQGPGSFGPSRLSGYARTSQPVFAWSQPRGWGPLQYSLVVDGATVGQTYADSMVSPAALGDGPHRWQVSVANPAGQQRQTKAASIFIDTVAPRVKLKLRGPRVIGRALRARVDYLDRPPAGQPRPDASGVAKVVIRWGDGTVRRLTARSHLADHVYRRSGRYRITVIVTDKAGNVSKLVMRLRVRRHA